MSLLPIKGQKTLIYGSRDAGRTVVASDERFNEAMRIAAKTLNVSSCLRGIKAPGTLMHSAIDIEGAVFLVHFGNSQVKESRSFGRRRQILHAGFCSRDAS
jgi:hypothetical protein